MQSFTADFAAPLQGSRDLVFMDQRGTGRSTPSLACPEVSTVKDAHSTDESLAAATARDVASLLACHDRLINEGVDLGGYTTENLAADARDVLRALGYREWNLYGFSQSTRIAQVLMRDSPAGEIRSALLDSAIPIYRAHLAEYPTHIDRTLRRLAAECTADTSCARAFPDLGRVLFEVLVALNESPFAIDPIDPATGQPFRIVLTGDLLANLFFTLSLQDTTFLSVLPFLARQLERRESSLIGLPAGLLAGNAAGDAMLYSVICQDQIPLMTPEVLARGAQGIDSVIANALAIGETALDIDTCRGWSGIKPISAPPPAVESEIPTLLLAGELDFAAPPEYAHELAVTLRGSTVVELRGHGHGQLYVADAPPGQPTCAMSLTAQHYADPGRPIDTSCAAALPALHFAGS